MTRCDYDVAFYRVFCIILLVIAFTFTVILTNVFIDIDGLLMNPKTSNVNFEAEQEINEPDFVADYQTPFNEEALKDVDYEFGRRKRSLDSSSFFFTVQNPNVKHVLISKLSDLLQDMDNEEEKDKTIDKISPNEEIKSINSQIEDIDEQNKFHLNMHSILMQGLLGHMDLSKVYKNVQNLLRGSKDNKDLKIKPTFLQEPTERNVDDELLKEFRDCKKLYQQVLAKEINKDQPDTRKHMKEDITKPKTTIKAVIDIITPNKKNDFDLNEVQGVVQLKYNGIPIDVETENSNLTHSDHSNFVLKSNNNSNVNIDTITEKNNNRSNVSLENPFNEINVSNKTIGGEEAKSIRNKRETKKNNTIEDDDDLFIEIETHFSNKGMKSEKKKKVIKNLIEKIKKAIHSNSNDKTSKSNKQKHFSVKKRTQNSFETNNKTITNMNSNIMPRSLYPIFKIARKNSGIPEDITREVWKRTSPLHPKFLSPSKSINSAEINEIPIDYDKILKPDGIPQRLQKPLNSDTSEEIANEAYYNFGNLSFAVEDVDGTGFAVGFNQYRAEPPDADNIKVFTGMQSFLNTYNENFENTEPINEYGEELLHEKPHDINKRNVEFLLNSRNDQKRLKRDFHSSNYEAIFGKSFLPFQNYQGLNARKNKTQLIQNNVDLQKSDMFEPFALNYEILDKELKPAEIFGIANYLDRNKRSTKRKIKNTLQNNHIKTQRFLNTRSKGRRTFIVKSNRNKRDINKIRIVTTDDLSNLPRNSEEKIFIVSDEDLFTDRVVGDINYPQPNERILSEHNDVPFIYEDYKVKKPVVNQFIGGNLRDTPLMSKYPHIFMEEFNKPKDDFLSDKTNLYKLIQRQKVNFVEQPKIENIPLEDSSTPSNLPYDTDNVEDLLKAMLHPGDSTNYKITVKLSPKNQTDVNAGFKEVRTLINKSFNKNGLYYSTSVNMTETSKIEKLNTSSHDKVQKSMDKLSKFNTNYAVKQEETTNLPPKLPLPTPGDKTIDANTKNDFIDLSINPPKSLRIRKEDINNLLLSILSNFQLPIQTTTSMSTIADTTTIKQTTLAPTTVDPMKKRLFHSIRTNENFTSEILKKINQNTEILQAFLSKISEKLSQTTTTVPKVEEKQVYDLPMLEPRGFQFPYNFRQSQDPSFINSVPQLHMGKNETRISIPFLYAYQKPFSNNVADLKDANKVASIIYHGHIHANSFNNHEIRPQNKDNNLVSMKNINEHKKNQTGKFFFDDLDNDYKILPNTPKNVSII